MCVNGENAEYGKVFACRNIDEKMQNTTSWGVLDFFFIFQVNVNTKVLMWQKETFLG